MSRKNRGSGSKMFGPTAPNYLGRKGKQDWTVAGTSVNPATGAQVVGPVGWSGVFAGVVSGTPAISQAFQAPLPAAVPSGAPAPGEFQVSAMHGSVFLANFSAAATYQVAVGIYVAKNATRTVNIWDVRNLLDGKWAMEDDFLYLRAEVFQCTTAALNLGLVMVEFPLMLPRSIYLGTGEALHVQIEVTGGAAGMATADAFLYYRTKVTQAI